MSNRFFRICALVIAACSFPFSANAQSLLRDTEIEEFVEYYSFPIYRAAGLPAENINFFLIGDQTPNAFAGGLNMGIHTGLITTADTPNQIEGVIAHEAGHIAGGHTARSDEALSAVRTPMILSLVLAAGAVAAGSPEAGIGLLGLGQNIAQATILKYSRGQEASADQAAITYLNAVGHSGEGLIQFFGKLRNYQIITGRRVNPYLQSHPLANQRMVALTERTENSPFKEVENTEAEIKQLRMIQAKIYGFLEEAHFTLRRYPLSDNSDPARYGRAVAYFRISDIEKGLSEINTLLEKYPANPYFYELKGQMLFEFGRVDESIEPHAKSVELAPESALLRINLGRAYLATENASQYENAVTELKAALRIEPENSFGWFELARAYGALDREPMAHLATAESRYTAGDKAQANMFARRALRGLKSGTPEWRQASDIILASQDDGAISLPLPEEVEKEPEPTAPPPTSRPGDVPDPQIH